jgi:drug/metabolite transporter (DMT)-like permease
MKFINKFPDSTQGIFYCILSCFFASILIAIVRHLSQEFSIFLIVMMRNFFGLIFLIPQIIKQHNTIFYTKKIGLHIFRAINGMASMMIWFYVITLIPLAEAVSISFIIPIITTFAAIFFLKEKVYKRTWFATFIGLLGILIILRPGFKEFKIAYFYSLISVFLWVVSNIVIKTMTKTEKTQTIVVYTSCVMFICSIPLAFPYFRPITFEYLLWFATLGLVSNLVYLFVSISYSKTDLSIVQPFDFSRLIFTAIISYFAFGEVVDIWVIIGSLIILFGVIIVAPKQNSKKQIISLQE